MSPLSARLVPLNQAAGLSEFVLLDRELSIGRSRQCDLYLDDPSVSRLHARIRPSDGGYRIEDAGSLHGTIVNGRQITSHQLTSQDTIQLGVYKFQFVDPTQSTADVTVAQGSVDYLRLLLRVTQLISSSLALDEVLKHVIDGVIQVTGAERGFLMMVTPASALEFRVARNFDQTALNMDQIAASSSIPERVRRTGRAIVLSDTVGADVSGSIVELGLKSVMCVPLKSQSGVLGVIYVDSRQTAKRFSSDDLELFESLAGQAALAIEKSQLYEELQRYSTSLEQQVRDRTAELLQSEKMAAVGRLAASIAHEINSPLGVITSNIDMLRHLATTVAGDQHREIVDDIAATFATANARLNRVIKAFQVLTGLDQAELRPVDINTLLDEVLTLTQGEAGTGVEVIRKSGALDRVLCSPGRVAQAFLNILTNAVQSLNGNGQIVIRTEQLEKRVRVVIADTGRGMTREQIATAFDPGFQRKDGRVSASLGLMITAQVIREHRGEIHIESTPGSGTIVTVTLPN